jgi:hypothetical protein
MIRLTANAILIVTLGILAGAYLYHMTAETTELEPSIAPGEPDTAPRGPLWFQQ